MDRGPEFKGPFQEMMEEFKIPYTPSSPYNSPSNGLAERHVGIKKLLLKKSMDNKKDFQENLSHLNNSARPDGHSPAELFYRHRPRCLMPDIVIDAELEEGVKLKEQSHQLMRTKMRKMKDGRKFQKGNYILCRNPTGDNKGK